MIKIKFNPNGDTRTLDHEPTCDEIIKARKDHSENIEEVMTSIADVIYNKGISHDHTVDEYIDEYCDLLQRAYRGEIDFVKSDWWKIHITGERHHLEAYMHEDANLMDLIECIVDRVVASKERGKASGDLNLTKDQVFAIYKNTIDYLNNRITSGE